MVADDPADSRGNGDGPPVEAPVQGDGRGREHDDLSRKQRRDRVQGDQYDDPDVRDQRRRLDDGLDVHLVPPASWTRPFHPRRERGRRALGIAPRSRWGYPETRRGCVRGSHYAGRVPPQPSPPAGRLIALEGGDGAGKSTQARLLADWLRGLGHEVVLTREPGDSRIGPTIRQLVLDPANAGLSDRAEALLYAADRAEHVAALVRPALARGAVVVTDRYIDSSIAYQGVGRGLGADAVAELSAFATGGLVADLTVVLDVPADVGRGRFDTADRLEGEPEAFHQRVRQAFLDLAAKAPERYAVVDATGPPDVVASQVRSAVARVVDVRVAAR